MSGTSLFIVLLSTGVFDRTNVAESLHGRIKFENKQDVLDCIEGLHGETFNKTDVRILPLENFIDEFNNQEIEQQDWWISYVTILGQN